MSKHFAMVGQDTVWAIGTDRQTTIAEARKWATFEPEEWDALAEDGRTGPRNDENTFQIVECTPEFAAHVERHGGAGIAWHVDGVIDLRD